MRKENSKFVTGFVSEAGAQLKNRDYFAFVELDNYACYVVADGIDDDQDLESAKMAVTSIIRSFSEYPSMRRSVIRGYLNLANRELLAESMDVKLKASVTVVITNYVKMVYAIVGNSRFNLLGDGVLKQASLDQSLSQDMNIYGNLPLDKIAQHEERNNLYCYLGQPSGFKPYISKKISLTDGDIIVLFTRGVWENTDTGELINAVSAASEPQDVLDDIEEKILSRQTLDLEDYTLAVIFVDKVYSDPNAEKKKKTIKIAIIVTLILAVLITVLVILFVNLRSKNKALYDTHLANANQYVLVNNMSRAIEEYNEAIKYAGKIGSKKSQEELNLKKTVLESIVEGDAALEKGDYSKAETMFIKARDASKNADNVAIDYIDKKLSNTKGFIEVHELLALGDSLLEQNQLVKAEEKYLEARKLAASIFYVSGRQQAMDNLKQVYEQQSLVQEELNRKVDLEAAAIALIKKGDESFADNDYDSAEMYYLMAKDKFESADIKDKSASIQEKIDLSVKKIADVSEKLSQATSYMEQANNYYVLNEIQKARETYILARDIYTELNYTKGLKEVESKLALLDKDK